MPRLGKRTTQVLSTVASVLLVLAVWWLQSQDDDSDGRADDRASSSSSPTASRSSSPAPSTAPSTGPSSAPTTAPSTRATTGPSTDEDGIAYVDLADLPPEAAETVELIDAGGPFPYPGKDGSTFGNFEGVLPDRERGYYAEYTVETPGLDHRGARRIIAGDGGELYWTEDHYESFERIRR